MTGRASKPAAAHFFLWKIVTRRPELGRVVIRSVKVKSGKTRVSYEVEAN